VHAFAEQVERGRDARGVETSHRAKRRFQRLSRYEPVGKAFCKLVVADEPEDLLLLGQIEKCAAKH
jgi:hypothetical protein